MHVCSCLQRYADTVHSGEERMDSDWFEHDSCEVTSNAFHLPYLLLTSLGGRQAPEALSVLEIQQAQEPEPMLRAECLP